VTEELVPGFKFSRASYLAGLLRPHIIEDLELQKYGFEYIRRDPSSFTPSLTGPSLLLGSNASDNFKSIAQFSARDAANFPKYEEFLGKVRDIVSPLLDNAPPDLSQGAYQERLRTLKSLELLTTQCLRHRDVLVPFYELLTGPASGLLDRWFESDMLKATLATDAVVGALISPQQAGSAYVLLHHVMGEAAGQKGVWCYVKGGMGAVSQAIAQAAVRHGAEIATHATVRGIEVEGTSGGTQGRVKGVRMADGSLLSSEVVLAGASPYHTFVELMADPQTARYLPEDFVRHIKHSGE